MASLSASTLKFHPLSSSLHNIIIQGSGRRSSIVSLDWGKSSFPTLKTSHHNLICAAKKETVDKVCEIVREKLALAADAELTADSEFSKLGADSLDTLEVFVIFSFQMHFSINLNQVTYNKVEIVMNLEEEFGINVDEDKAQDISTIQQAAEVIESLLEKK